MSPIAMDVSAICTALQNTLSSSNDLRKKGEENLIGAVSTPGYALSLLQICTHAEADGNVRLAGAIYFKNFISRHWKPYEDRVIFRVSMEDRTVVMDHIVEALFHSPDRRVQKQIGAALKSLISYEDNISWVVQKAAQYLTSDNPTVVHGALLATLQLARKYEYKKPSSRDDFEKALTALLPLLFRVADGLIARDDKEAYEMVYLILKVFKSSLICHLPKTLMEPAVLDGMMGVMLNVAQRPFPVSELHEDVDERPFHPLWKAKKWALYSLYTLFHKYGIPLQVSEDYKKFATLFSKTYSVRVLQATIAILESTASGNYVTPRVRRELFHLLNAALQLNTTWKHMKPVVQPIIQGAIFPSLCHSDSDEELWQTDQHEYIRIKYDPNEGWTSPAVAGINFIKDLANKRESTFVPIITFCNDILNQYEAATTNAKDVRSKDGALFIIGSLAPELTKKKAFKNDLEGMMIRHVFPEFRNGCGFLRARACWLVRFFSNIKFSTHETILNALDMVVQCIKDPDLPVRIEAALALQSLVEHSIARNALRPNVKPIMQEFLRLTHETENDDLTNVMETLVDEFRDVIIPFAGELMEELARTFINIMGNAEEDGEGEGSNRTLTAMGILNTVYKLCDIVASEAPDQLVTLEPTAVGLVIHSISIEALEFMEDLMELVLFLSFNRKAISPTLWSLFPVIYEAFGNWAIDYFPEISPVLENYIHYGTDVLFANDDYMKALSSMCNNVLGNDNLGENDYRAAFRIMQTALAVSVDRPGSVDNYVSMFLEKAVTLIFDDSTKTDLTTSEALAVVSAALYARPELSLSTIMGNPTAARVFLPMWLKKTHSLSKSLNHQKFAVLAVNSIIELASRGCLPIDIVSILGDIIPITVDIFSCVVEHYALRAEMENEEVDDVIESEDDDEDDDNFNALDDDEDFSDDEGKQYQENLEMLARKCTNAEGEFDFDLFDEDDDGDIDSVVENVDEFIGFKTAMEALKLNNSELFSTWLSPLTEIQQGILLNIIHEADQHVAKKQSEMIQQAGGYSFDSNAAPVSFQFGNGQQ